MTLGPVKHEKDISIHQPEGDENMEVTEDGTTVERI